MPGKYSPIWRRLTKARSHTTPYIRWGLGRGNNLFWDDIWLGDTPIREMCLDERGDQQTRVSDLWKAEQWSMPKLSSLLSRRGLPQTIFEEILQVPILADEPDLLRWTLTSNGNSALASTWKTLRFHRPVVPSLELLWNDGLMTSISIFIWRLISNRIPVDTKLQGRRIELASKCHCCLARSNIESVPHLFIKGDGASKVWRNFDEWFPGRGYPLQSLDSIPDRMEIWSKRIDQKAMKHIGRLVPYLIFWFLWAERKECRHKGVRFRSFSVIWQVQTHLRKLIELGSIGPPHWQATNSGLQTPHSISTGGTLVIKTRVKWKPPEVGELKMNVHGCLSKIGGK